MPRINLEEEEEKKYIKLLKKREIIKLEKYIIKN